MLLFVGQAISQIDNLVKESIEKIGDKSNVFYTEKYNEAHPSTVEEVKDILKYAEDNSLRIKIRGRGHSANGSSISKNEKEILVFTESFSKIEFIDQNSILVGAGVVMYELKKQLNKSGFDLFTCNEGGSGPTLGGYISAGGIGSNGDLGFWECVEEIHWIDGKGKNHVTSREDSEFKWMFGSMGELGLIYQAKIKIKKSSSNDWEKEYEYPFNPDFNFFWYPIIVSELEFSKFTEVFKNEIENLVNKYAYLQDSLKIFYNKAGIFVEFSSFNPPLLTNNQQSFYIIGGKILVNKKMKNYNEIINALRSDFDGILIKYQLESYFQVSYYEANSIALRKYLGKKRFNKFKKIRKKYDPEDLFGLRF